MGAGVVYAVIIAMWAIVLVPMWLQRHDQANEARSADRFQIAMRRLRSSKFVEANPADPAAPAAVTAPMRLTVTQRAAAKRRRNVLLVLMLVILLTLAAGLVGVVPVWAPSLPTVLLLAFLVAAFNAAQRSPATTARRTRLIAPATVTPAFAGVPDQVSLPIAVGMRPGEWAPTYAPLPTYVNAPAATRVPRLLDLRTPGKWTSAAMLDQVAAARSAKVHISSFADLFVDDAPTVDVGGDDLDTLIERRAASG